MKTITFIRHDRVLVPVTSAMILKVDLVVEGHVAVGAVKVVRFPGSGSSVPAVLLRVPPFLPLFHLLFLPGVFICRSFLGEARTDVSEDAR